MEPIVTAAPRADAPSQGLPHRLRRSINPQTTMMNLTTDPWIPVVDAAGVSRPASLHNVFAGDHQDLAVRLGGIYALERIAFDSPRDHWTIVEVLTAYVREKARWEEPDGYRSQMASMNDRDFDPNDREAHAAAYPRVTADVQAILTVLGRRQWKHDQGKLDLTHLNLRGVVLTDAHFAGANLSGSSLEMALLDGAVLRGVTARRTWFDGAILNHVDLRDADLWGAQLMEAEVNDARLEKAKLVSAYLPDAEFRRSRLDDADLNSAKVMGTRFEGASLRGVDLGYAQGLRPGQLDKAVLDDRTKLPGKPDKLPQTI